MTGYVGRDNGILTIREPLSVGGADTSEGTDGSARRPCSSEGVGTLLEGPAPCPRSGAARRAAHGGRLVAKGLQGGLRTLDDGVGRGCSLGRDGRRIQGSPRGRPERGRSAVAHRADGRLFLWRPLATAPHCAPTVP